MNYSELRARTYDDLGQPGTGNDLLTAARVNDALAYAYRMFAMETNCFKRQAQCLLADGQADYTLPRDLYAVRSAAAGIIPTALTPMSVPELEMLHGLPWGCETAARPRHWYQERAGMIGVYPEPCINADMTLYLVGWHTPHLVAAIDSIARNGATGEVTVVTSAAHGLARGETIRIHGVATSSFNTRNVVVATVPSAASFTFAQDGDTEVDLNGGAVGYGFGVLPLIDDTDEPDLHPVYHEALVCLAVHRLASRYLRTDPAAMERANAALQEYAAYRDALRQSLLW